MFQTLFTNTFVHFSSFFYCLKTSTCFQVTNNAMKFSDIPSKCIHKCHIKAFTPYLFSTYLEISAVLSVSTRKPHFIYIFNKTVPTISLLSSNPFFVIITSIPWSLLTCACPPIFKIQIRGKGLRKIP